jgi:O-antigen/teichoic acid export membrane protein
MICNAVKKWFDYILTIALFFIFFAADHLVENYAYEYQHLATSIPVLVVVIPIVLFGIKFVLLYQALNRMKKIRETIKHYRFKVIVAAFSTSTFLYADIILVYALAMGYFAFAFDTINEQFFGAWNQYKIAGIAFTLLSIFSLVCMRTKSIQSN